MSNKDYEFIDAGLLNSIVQELSELNRNISKAERGGYYPRSGNIYFFNDKNKRSWSVEEHLIYSSFMRAVTDCLKDFGIHINNNGYSYIIEAVKILLDYGSFDVRMINDVYPFIAGKYRLSSYEAIEHRIRNAINSAYKDHIKDPNCNKMGLFRKKPSSKEFIIYVAEKVSRVIHDEVYTS